MSKHPERRSAHVEVLRAAPEQEPIVDNLLQLYAHDFSEFHNIELGADGRFEYRNLQLYWREPNWHPFLVKVDGKLVGFVFVKRGSEISPDETIWDMAEFFVIRSHRRRGIGTEIAQAVWRQLPGGWEVRVLDANRAAHQFWQHAVSEFMGKAIRAVRVEKGGEHWSVFSFESVPNPVRHRAPY